MFLVKVLVQLPDGSFDYCAVAKEGEFDGPELVKFSMPMNAREWAGASLPDKVKVIDEDRPTGFVLFGA